MVLPHLQIPIIAPYPDQVNPVHPDALPLTTAHNPETTQPRALTESRRHRTLPTPAPLPPMGPAWWGGVMGTGIVGSLTQLSVGDTSVGAFFARFFLVAGWVVMIGFTAGFVHRIRHDRAAWSESIHGVGASAWGMVSMGLMSVGSATNTVLSAWNPALERTALIADVALWIVGTLLGLRTTFGFTFSLLRHRPEGPRPAWGLAVVPPMVSATTGTAFIPWISSDGAAFALLAMLSGFFVCSLTLAAIIFYAAFHHHRHVDAIPTQLAVSAWIPLGPVGQSTAAAHVISVQTDRFLTPDAVPAAHMFADIYGVVMLTLAIPLVTLAAVLTIRGLRNGMKFSPGWWAMTFPVGTLSLGAYYLGLDSGFGAYSYVSLGIWMFLLFTWSVCAWNSAKHLLQKQA